MGRTGVLTFGTTCVESFFRATQLQVGRSGLGEGYEMIGETDGLGMGFGWLRATGQFCIRMQGTYLVFIRTTQVFRLWWDLPLPGKESCQKGEKEGSSRSCCDDDLCKRSVSQSGQVNQRVGHQS